MFIATFYSYKGGVGRTMALVNVAAELTTRGKRVLIIDFDLEAPGVPSFEPFHGSRLSLGIVDYVTQYIETAVAPNVADFIVETHIESDQIRLPIWILPAGKGDETYSQKLASIDWREVYEYRSGYLLFEDLKQQLEQHPKGFDYVLIDSRTGHTDVGGICTRQLADAVVSMFFPNSQNISGLQTIVDEIRADKLVKAKGTKLLFCASNVPDLDDEEGILRTMLEMASRNLGYEKPSATIRHYNSLSLVEQKIFVVDRPNTKLANEYRMLTDAVSRENLGDRDGALLALRKINSDLKREKRENRPSRVPARRPSHLLNTLEKIGSMHRHDGEIFWRIAAIYNELNELANELEALNGAIEAGFNKPRTRLRRAYNLLSQSRHKEARQDLVEVLSSTDSTPIELRSALEALRLVDKNWVSVVAKSPVLHTVKPEDVGILANVLMSRSETLPIAKDLVVRALDEVEGDDALAEDLVNELTLILIGLGKFTEALGRISHSRDQLLQSNSIADLFNYSMAEWGLQKHPPKDLLERMLDLVGDTDNDGLVNFNQCLGLASAAIGRTDDAIQYIRKARDSLSRSSVFSCWTYLMSSPSEVANDLNAMSQQIASDILDPPFMHSRASELQ
ncbi:ParA family protein [Rhizobium leguminosarum]|uniref:ParA family protein n=1 Tax=Rhizobium leguminosarum TaxID=384 RepID=UPI003F9B9DED